MIQSPPTRPYLQHSGSQFNMGFEWGHTAKPYKHIIFRYIPSPKLFILYNLSFSPCFRIATLPMDLIGFGYAALVTFGSIFGYKRRGGVLSLIAGLFVGCLAGYGAYRVSNDKRDVKVSLFTAFFLATIMGVRFKRSKKIMPAGLVAGLSLMMILRLVLLLL
uniref:Transmembrane protein 14A n=1 Tax=Macaca mulatta TaxID=9544 RepID=A0A5F7ZWQ1_MACMU